MFHRIDHLRRTLVCGLLGITAAALLASCDLGEEVVSPPPPPVVAQVLITSHADTVLAAVAAPVQFAAVALDASGTLITNAAISWSSSAVNVAAVDASGQALALTSGFTNIRARSGAIQSAPTVLRVHPVIASIVITGPLDPEVEVGRTLQLAAEARDAGGTAIAAIPFDWITNDTNVALVDAFGIALGIAEGRTDVRATRGAVQSAPVELRVRRQQQVVASVHITGPLVPQVEVGSMIAFTAEARDALGDPIAGATFQWFSSNPSAASVDVSGVAIGLAVGMSDIRARSDGIDSAPVTLTVRAPAVATVEISGPSQVDVGSMATFIAIARDAGGAPITGAAFTWSSSNTSVARVDSNGITTGLAVGSADIRATSESVASAPAALTVVTPATSFATDIQPILNMSCNFSNCHGSSMQEGLDLRAAAAYGELVNQLSSQFPSLLRVAPGNPDNSYFYRKLLPCSPPNCGGSRMPRGLPPLSTAQLDLIRNWIQRGAQP